MHPLSATDGGGNQSENTNGPNAILVTFVTVCTCVRALALHTSHDILYLLSTSDGMCNYYSRAAAIYVQHLIEEIW